MGQIYGGGAVLGQMWVRSMWQEKLLVRSMGLVLLRGRCGSDLWVRRCCGDDMGQIYGAGAAVEMRRVRTMW